MAIFVFSRKKLLSYFDEGYNSSAEARQEISPSAFGEDGQEISIAVWRRESNQRTRPGEDY